MIWEDFFVVGILTVLNAASKLAQMTFSQLQYSKNG